MLLPKLLLELLLFYHSSFFKLSIFHSTSLFWNHSCQLSSSRSPLTGGPGVSTGCPIIPRSSPSPRLPCNLREGGEKQGSSLSSDRRNKWVKRYFCKSLHSCIRVIVGWEKERKKRYNCIRKFCFFKGTHCPFDSRSPDVIHITALCGRWGTCPGMRLSPNTD